MIKIVKKLYEDKEFIKGYGYMPNHIPKELTQDYIWEQIYEIGQNNPNTRYVKYIISEEFIENKNLPSHIVDNPEVPYTKIPVGTNIWWLTVYLEEK